MCIKYVWKTSYFACGDTTEQFDRLEECQDKGKAGHQPVTLACGSTIVTDEKCGQSNCRKP